MIDHVIERGIKAGGYPGASVVVGRRGAAVWQKGFGKLSWGQSSTAVNAERTIYDLASLTKVVGTTTALMVLYDEGKIHLDDPVSQYIPGFRRAAPRTASPCACSSSIAPASGRPRPLAHSALARRSARSGHRHAARLRAGPLLRVLRPRRRHARLRRRSGVGPAARSVPRASTSSSRSA